MVLLNFTPYELGVAGADHKGKRSKIRKMVCHRD